MKRVYELGGRDAATVENAASEVEIPVDGDASESSLGLLLVGVASVATSVADESFVAFEVFRTATAM